MAAGQLPLDWGFAETLAYATLLTEGFEVRLVGQDSGRGTFFHRHAVWHDQNRGEAYVPLKNLAPSQPRFTVIDSLLSEEAVVGFEYGFSTTEPNCLTLWEAQFGDFVNGAQVIIDQFISSGEAKWGRLCGLTLLLPHGYEGQGPEHSSARLERFLQLCAEQNMQVCVPSTPAQMFHMLRRQMRQDFRKPLIVMTPKSLLRHKLSVSPLEDLTRGSFRRLIDEVDDVQPAKVTRVVFCSGKVYFDLLESRRTRRAAQRRHRARRAAVSVPGRRVRGDHSQVRAGARDRLVPGRAAEPGRVVPDPPSPERAADARASPAVRRARTGRGAGDRHRPDAHGSTETARRCSAAFHQRRRDAAADEPAARRRRKVNRQEAT